MKTTLFISNFFSSRKNEFGLVVAPNEANSFVQFDFYYDDGDSIGIE
jgi:hypothetical protein